MRSLIQKVLEASVAVEGEEVGSIGPGLLVLFGVHCDDTGDLVDKMARKVAKLRVFPDEEGKMNRSVQDIEGEVLVVSQFTLYGDCSNGSRPSFTEAARGDAAKQIYLDFVESLKGHIKRVATGRFAAPMVVQLVNEGPVTILIEL